MTYNLALAHQVVTELQALRDGPGFVPDPNIDTVWVLSAPGTYFEEANDGTYSGKSFDRMNIEAGITAVRGITAARLGKPEEEVTKEDIAEHGPTLFYNGEDENTENVNYLQNEAMERAVKDPAFPLPESKVTIEPIPTIGTPAQVVEFAKYAQDRVAEGEVPPQKIAVVSLFAHSARVGRYLHKYEPDFPEGTEFVSVPVPEGEDGIGAAVRETRKVMTYAAKGHLSHTSAFAKPQGPQQPEA